MTDVRQAMMVGRSSDGRLVQRPLSPHLQIYKPQISSALSIFHRISGIALSAGALLLVCFLVSAAEGDAAYDGLSSFLRSWLGVLLLFGWTVALFYHLCNGIRHLWWDTGHGLELKSVYASGWTVVGATAVLTVIAWIAGLSGWSH